MVSKIRAGCAFLLAAALFAAACAPRPSERSGYTNAILIVVDTLRADHLGAYGYRRPTSPAIDALSARGVRFETALAHSSWSPPSHSSIVTSRYPSTHRMDHWGTVLAPDIRVLPEMLREAGFTTAFFTQHLGLKVGTEGLFRGLDRHEDFPPEQEHRMTDAVTAWLGEPARNESPFFLWLIYTGPHAPYNAPEPFKTKFASEPDPDERQYPFVSDHWIGVGGIPVSVRMGNEQRASFYLDRYDGEVAYTDSLIGRVLETLERQGLDDDTLVMLTSDHGEALGEHEGAFAHGLFLYDTLIRVPLIVAPVAVEESRRVIREPAQLVDVVPTMLDFLGVDRTDRLEGISLKPWILGTAQPERRLAYGSFRDQGFRRYYLRTDQWKLIWNDDKETLEVYDLAADPGETNNLGTDIHKLPEEAVRLTRRLREDIASYDRSSRPTTRELSPEAEEALKSLGYLQ